MLTKSVPPTRSHAAAEQARVVGVILRDEFDAPFAFQDAATGARVGPRDGDDLLTERNAAAVARGGAAVVEWVGGAYLVSLPVYVGGRAALVATGRLAAVGGARTEDPRERRRLERWVQGVHDRLRKAATADPAAEDRARALAPWDAVVALDHLIRKARPHRHSASGVERVLRAAREAVGASAVVWVPAGPDDAVVGSGPTLSAADLRRLVAALDRPAQTFVCNDARSQPWAARFPTVTALAACPATDRGPLGWVLALASADDPSAPARGFRTAELALLAPFVALIESQARSASRYQDLKELLVGLTRALSAALDAKDKYTQGHSERVARIAVELGRDLGMGEEELGNLYLAGLLHDIGKIGVREAVLGKPGALTPDEFAEMKRHVTIGHAILADLHQLRSLLPGVLYHHERYDGGGYPEGLSGEGIPLLGRILAVADSYDAMTTTRPYREGMTPHKAAEVLAGGAGRQWDPRVVEAALRCADVIRGITDRGVGGESLRRALTGAMGRSGHDPDYGPTSVVGARPAE